MSAISICYWLCCGIRPIVKFIVVLFPLEMCKDSIIDNVACLVSLSIVFEVRGHTFNVI